MGFPMGMQSTTFETKEASQSAQTIKVLIVDDAAFMRKAILDIVQDDAKIEVVGSARNGQEALEQIVHLRPDVVTLDIDMPVMDGLTTIRHIMIKHPTAIVVLSSLACDGRITFDALRLGVVDFMPKPSGAVSPDIDRSKRQLIDRIKIASEVNLANIRRVRIPQWHEKQEAGRAVLEYLVVVGTTLGGPNTIIRLLSNLTPRLPAAIVVIMEISPKIIAEFLRRFDMLVPWEVCEAQDGMPLRQGICYFSPSCKTVRIQTDADGTIGLRVSPGDDEPLNQLFVSAADVFRSRTVGVLLTGVGSDGADGLNHIRKSGGVTIAQNTKTCVYPNLTENAISQGTVDMVLDESELPQKITALIME